MTIKDIARQCSVSVSTVSRVLNDRPDVSDDVRRKVLSAIKASNYIPNNSARDLVRTKSDAIGLIVRGVSNPFYTDIIRTIESTITDAGFTMVMQQIGACDDEVKCGAVMEREKRLRGIIFLGGRFDYTPADLALLNVPFVCCSYSNRYGTLTEGEYSSVSIADGDTAQQAVEELYRHGHRRIAALISRPDDQSISHLACHEATLLGRMLQRVKVHVKPVKRLTLALLVKHLIVHLAIIPLRCVPVKVSIFVLKHIAQVRRVSQHPSARSQQRLAAVEQ